MGSSVPSCIINMLYSYMAYLLLRGGLVIHIQGGKSLLFGLNYYQLFELVMRVH